MPSKYRLRITTKISKRRSVKGSRSEYRKFVPYAARRVFIHELGHYVADTINHQLYGMRSVKGIEIYKSPSLTTDYEGETKITSEGVRPFKPTQRMLPAYFAALAYGCIFESAYLDMPDMLFCMDNHGRSDIDKRNDFVKDPTIKQALSGATDAHYQILVNSNLGQYLQTMIVNKFVRNGNTDRIQINISLLRTELSSWTRRHASSYIRFVNELKRIL